MAPAEPAGREEGGEGEEEREKAGSPAASPKVGASLEASRTAERPLELTACVRESSLSEAVPSAEGGLKGTIGGETDGGGRKEGKLPSERLMNRRVCM
eukprot:scaffold293334_cov27-Tisochrysis_lutea.AAC.4